MEIILYDCHQREKQVKKARQLRKTGLGLIIISFTILLLALGPLILKDVSYQLENKSKVLSKDNSSFFPSPSLSRENNQAQIKKEAETYGIDSNFSLVIPKINAVAKIIPNVNPADEKEYKETLKKGVAHALGTGFPGEGKTIYLFAHSTNSLINVSRYNAIFYLLKELKTKDKIIIFFNDQKFIYEVKESFITSAQDTRWLTENQKDEKLILQTCWPPGTSLKRLLVIAEPETKI